MHTANNPFLVVIGNWDGYGKWTGAVFGPTSKIINNECGGESKQAGEIGGKESRRIKGNYESHENLERYISDEVALKIQ